MDTAFTAKGLSVAERKARLAELVQSGAITPEEAAWVDFREPPPAVLEHAAQLGAGLKSRMEKLFRASEQ